MTTIYCYFWRNLHDSCNPRGLVVALFMCLSAGLPTNVAADEILPADVYQQMDVILSNLDRIRAHLDIPEKDYPQFDTHQVKPREVIFQADHLFALADQLAFEHTYTREMAPTRHITKVRPVDVLKVVKSSSHRIALVAEKYGFSTSLTKPNITLKETITPGEVFGSIHLANQILNSLVSQETRPREIFTQVTYAVGLSSRLLSLWPTSVRIPEPELNMNVNTSAADIHTRLLNCFRTLRSVSAHMDGEPADINFIHNDAIISLNNEDAYHMATLIVSELAYLHSRSPALKPPVKRFDPGEKNLTEVNRRVSILETQTKLLAQLVKTTTIADKGLD